MKDEADLVYHALSFWPYEVNSDLRRYTQKVLEIGRENALDAVMEMLRGRAWLFKSEVHRKKLEWEIQQLKQEMNQ